MRGQVSWAPVRGLRGASLCHIAPTQGPNLTAGENWKKRLSPLFSIPESSVVEMPMLITHSGGTKNIITEFTQL